MSLSDKYGNNSDIEAKYSKPKPKIIIDESTYPAIRPGYEGIYYPGIKYERDIRIEKRLKQEYINLLVDAKDYITRLESAKEKYDRKVVSDFHEQVLSQDKKYALLMYLGLTTTDNYDSKILIPKVNADKQFDRYYALDESRQGYAKITINSGTFRKYFDELMTDYDTSDLYFFNDGNIYCVGETAIQVMGVDYLSLVLEEAIDKINKEGGYKGVPEITANVIFEEENGNNRAYIKSRNIRR